MALRQRRARPSMAAAPRWQVVVAQVVARRRARAPPPPARAALFPPFLRLLARSARAERALTTRARARATQTALDQTIGAVVVLSSLCVGEADAPRAPSTPTATSRGARCRARSSRTGGSGRRRTSSTSRACRRRCACCSRTSSRSGAAARRAVVTARVVRARRETAAERSLPAPPPPPAAQVECVPHGYHAFLSAARHTLVCALRKHESGTESGWRDRGLERQRRRKGF